VGTSAAATSAASESGRRRRAARLLLGATVLASGIAACADAGTGSGGIPDRAPDVTGVVDGAGTPGGPALADPSDDYFAGMALAPDDAVVVRGGADGALAALRDGEAVEVWIDWPCQESFPVQCTVVALRVGP
jgi:hypothetical protein